LPAILSNARGRLALIAYCTSFPQMLASKMLILRIELVEEKPDYLWTPAIGPRHDDEAVGLPLSDAKEFAKDRSEASVLDRALVSLSWAVIG
jgi:hypothetical protein